VNPFWAAVRELSQGDEPFVVVTMVSTRGHAPQDPGAKIAVTAQGLAGGTIGGGKVEAKAIGIAQERLAAFGKAARVAAPPELVTWNLQRDVGMTCGGEATLLFETHAAQAWRIHVFGAGHVGQATVRALEALDCRITCVDPRPEWLEKLPRSPKITPVCVPDALSVVESLPEDGYFVLMTRGHATDYPLARAILRRFPRASYVGMLGSKVKALKVRAELKTEGYSDEEIARLRCPMGLPVGGNQPAEIAISVAAQLLQARDRRGSQDLGGREA
jgi:xanthine dehydrogenase accessory factor